MKLYTLLLAVLCLLVLQGNAQTNIFPSSGYAGIGTTTPGASLHIRSPNNSAYIFVDKDNSGYESGIAFLKAGAANFYIWSDNSDNDALKIEASGLPGEHDLQPRMMFPLTNTNIYMALSGGNVGIGTSTPKETLSVNGKIRAKEIKVETANWPDYVLEENYVPQSLNELEKYIKANKHLPEIPSTKEVEENGLSLGKMNAKLLKKIEELTLYLIEQNKQIQEQNKRIEQLEKNEK